MKYIYKLQWYTRKIRIKAYALLVNLIQKEQNDDINNTLLVIGTTRSGTTYLMENLNRNNSYRLIFEPFIPEYTKQWESYNTRHYVNPRKATKKDKEAINAILSGSIRNKWVDQFNKKINSNQRLIKAVRANQLIPFIRQQYPSLDIIYLIRDPYKVVASRMSLDFDPDDVFSLLSNNEFISSHFEDINIDNLKSLLTTSIRKHTALWALENRFLMRNIDTYKLHLISHKEIIEKTVTFSNGTLDISDHYVTSQSVSTSPKTKRYMLSDLEKKQIKEVLSIFGMEN